MGLPHLVLGLGGLFFGSASATEAPNAIETQTTKLIIIVCELIGECIEVCFGRRHGETVLKMSARQGLHKDIAEAEII